MKIFFSTLLALAMTSTSIRAENTVTGGSGSALQNAWSMSDPVAAFADNNVTLTYGTSSTETFLTNVHINEAFYDKDCNPAVQITAGQGIGDQTNPALLPQASWDDANNQIKLDFKIQPEILNVGSNNNFYTDSGNGFGVLSFCVRTSLGYGGYSGDGAQDKTLTEQIEAGFKEVNFREAIFTITYDLTDGFDAISASVKPVIRDSEEQDVNGRYELTAWICDTTATYSEYKNDAENPTITRSYPPAAAAGDFNQGALIPVCIRPTDATYAENIVMRHINWFTWSRDSTTQPAIVTSGTAGVPGTTSTNRLTYHDNCVGGSFCLVESILFADFYTSEGTVTATGEAQVQFDTTIARRRLGESAEPKENRVLQEEIDSSSFELGIGVSSSNDLGPAALRTAGGVSIGLTALTSTLALVGACLLA